MKIYNVVKIPKGLGYDVDYDAIYQSGYTAGYHTGYDNGSELCSKFVLTPDELDYPISGGGNDVQITTNYSWVIDDDFEWKYEASWTGFSAESLNRIEVSENAGEGDKEITITAPDLTDAPRVFIGTTAVHSPDGNGFTAKVISRSGKLKATAKTEYGDYSKYVDVEQNMAQHLVFGPSGGSIPIILDTDGSDLDRYNIFLAYDFENDPYGHNNPWSAYTLNYSGSVTELPKTLTLTVPPYAEGLDPYWYGEDGEINVYYGFQFLNEIHPEPARFYITIQKPEVPRLYITHDFPTEEGQYREVPSTGATYTMTISGNSNWTANTVNFDGPDALCILSQSSGAANELTTVTVTFPESPTMKRGLVEIGTVDAPVSYYAFRFKQEAARKAPVTLTITSPGEIVFGRRNSGSMIPLFDLEVYLNGEPAGWWDSQHPDSNHLSVEEGDTVQLIVDRFMDPRSGWMMTSMERPAFFSGTTCEFELSGNLLSLLGREYENYDTIQEVWDAEYSASVPRYVLGGVFYGCTGLTDASKLIMPTDLTERSFAHMFENCTSLTKAPVLPAATLTSMCYRQMFRNCINLNAVKCLATDMSASMCTDLWLSEVASTGTFYKAPGSTWPSGDSGIPNNWTIIEEE